MNAAQTGSNRKDDPTRIEFENAEYLLRETELFNSIDDIPADDDVEDMEGDDFDDDFDDDFEEEIEGEYELDDGEFNDEFDDDKSGDDGDDEDLVDE